MSIRGSVDSLTQTQALGWVFCAIEMQAVTVEAILFGRIIGETLASEFRPDLAAAGLGDGNCGFAITFFSPVEAECLPMVTIRPRGGDVELPRTGLTGFADFFRAIPHRYPGAGRSRSFLGGLWTDRTDADRMLSGRLTTGATPADLETLLRDYIAQGYFMVPGVLAPMGLSAAEATQLETLPANEALRPDADPAARRTLEALPGVLFRELPLRAMRAILDDNPLVGRVMLSRFGAAAFQQPSNGLASASPNETLLAVLTSGDGTVEIDIVQGSHALPEFTTDGRSRWLASQAAAAVEIAVANGTPVETIQLTALDMAVIGPGTLYRIRPGSGATAVLNWISPARQTASATLQNNEGQFRVRHYSGASLSV